ncbi:hypothetical protein JL721_9457 [Aureococcus anophagefferens]|nr:hypothetical protein JL721_9457 [Aureococcus anophagefferens]
MLRSPRRWRSGSSAVVTSEFVAWLRAGGASFDKLAIKHTALGRGVVATAAYEPGETLLSRSGVEQRREPIAALFLAGDRSEAWRPYRNVISRSVSHLPCFWPTADEALAGSPLRPGVVGARDEIRDAMPARPDGRRPAAPTAFGVALLVDAGAKSSAWMPPGDDGDAPKLRIRLNGDDDGDFSAALSAYSVSVAARVRRAARGRGGDGRGAQAHPRRGGAR